MNGVLAAVQKTGDVSTDAIARRLVRLLPAEHACNHFLRLYFFT